MLSGVELGGWIPDYADRVLDLALPSSCEELSITYNMIAGPPDESFFTHEVMGRVTRLHMIYGKESFLAFVTILSDIW
jgi:hypothetical protein